LKRAMKEQDTLPPGGSAPTEEGGAADSICFASSPLRVIPAKAGIHLQVRVNAQRRFIPLTMYENPDKRQKA